MFPWSLLSSLLAEVKAMELHKFHLAFKNILSESFRFFKFNCVSFIYSGYIEVIFPERYATFSGSSLVGFLFKPDLRKKDAFSLQRWIILFRSCFKVLVSSEGFSCLSLELLQSTKTLPTLSQLFCPHFTTSLKILPSECAPSWLACPVTHPAQWHILPSWRPCSPLHCRSLTPFP